MPLFHKCGIRKIVMGIPSMLALALICFISFVFLFNFIPTAMPDRTTGREILRVVFGYFSMMTIVSILRILTSDPGYIDAKYKYPMKPNG